MNSKEILQKNFLYFFKLKRKIESHRKKGFIFVYKLKGSDISISVNPKAGITSTRYLLKSANIKYKNLKIKPKKLIDQQFSIFIFRNPYKRAVSMYLRFCNLINGSRGYLEKSIVNDFLIKNGYENGISFNQFLDYLGNVDVFFRDIHFQNQYIPENYSFLVRTDFYKGDILKAIKQLDLNIYNKIKNVDFSNIVKNSAAESRKDLKKDLSDTSSSAIISYGLSGFYPISENFLNEPNREKIEYIFRNDVDFYKNI
tara:strand:+ start:17903 stop:18670 length:768 start_codon:yes stop_codon:yes gene_type:complete